MRGAAAAALVLALSSAARASGEDEAAREAAMFGETSTAAARVAAMSGGTSTAAASEAAREAALFGERPGSGAGGLEAGTASVAADPGALDRIAERVGELSDTLELGGQLWLWGQATFTEGQRAADAAVSAPSFADLYLDARPSDRVRGFLGARLTHDFTVGPASVDFLGRPRAETRFLLDQWWVKLDVARTVFLTAGRQRVRWGSSRIWNPTDFLHGQVRDPLAFLDLRLGVPMLKLHVPVEALGWNFYAVAELEDVARTGEVGTALRAELVLGQAELALSAYRRADRPLGLGVDLSAGVWILDVRAEAGVRRGVTSPFLRGDLSFSDPVAIPEQYTREDDWIPQVVLGADVALPYNGQDSVVLGAEYLFNDAGYASERLYPALIALGRFDPLYASRHMVAVFALLSRPGRWEDTTILANAIASLDDGSVIARLDWSQRVLTFVDVRAFVSAHLGSEGVFRLALDVPPIDRAVLDAFGLPAALEGGLQLRPALLDVGVTLVVSL